MKRLTNVFGLLFFTFFHCILFSQKSDLKVESIINVGSYDFAYLYEIEKGEYFKTAAYSSGLLQSGNLYGMEVMDNDNQFNGDTNINIEWQDYGLIDNHNIYINVCTE